MKVIKIYPFEFIFSEDQWETITALNTAIDVYGIIFFILAGMTKFAGLW
jgi:hypothetical protein